MNRTRRRVSVAALAVGVAGVAGLLTAATLRPASGAAPTTTAATATVAPTTTAAPATVAPTGTDEPSTSAPEGFADGAEARAAAEQLLTVYIATEFGDQVTNAACSEPATGAIGEEFACYALKPGDLVIALRATVGPERLIELELLLDQAAPTTTAPPPTTAPVTTAG